ncbi:TPA: YadA-like family protein [Haemophilus influenzae]|uniref:YadA-like family protein n=1 Tax=Haemophilus influenzae TaxID=727 RepID=UPI00376F0405
MKKSLLTLSIIAGISAYANAEITYQSDNHIPVGLEFGDNSQAYGNGSITTGRNSLAMGTNAVATGNNETQETLLNKLEKNRTKLAEISTAEKTVQTTSKELDEIKKLNASIIEAGIRVEQIRKSKESARLVWQEKLKAYNDSNANYAGDIAEAQSKIDDLNSRLTGVSRIPNVDITSEEGLNRAATELKAIVENGTSLNLSHDFYKAYVKDYYVVLGDLDLNQARFNAADALTKLVRHSFNSGISFVEDEKNILQINSDLTLNNEKFKGKYYFSAIYEKPFKNGFFYNNDTLYINNDADNDSKVFFNLHSLNEDLKTIDNIDYLTYRINENDYSQVSQNIKDNKSAIRAYISASNNPLFNNQEVLSSLLAYTDSMADLIQTKYDLSYYQTMYEQTGNTFWLDKKAISLKKYEELNSDDKNALGVIALFYKHKSLAENEFKKQYKDKLSNWKKENITDYQERNKISVSTLTTQLEQALNINRKIVEEKQAELARLKQQAIEAENTYNNTNPSQADLLLSAEYERVKRELEEKSNTLTAQQAKLQFLRDNLTLNDLTNQGENAIAWGTNTLISGKNAIGIGTNSVVTGEQSIAIGVGHLVSGNRSSTIGDPNIITGNDVFVAGNNNVVKSDNVMVMGNNVTVETGFDNAVVLGANSEVSTANSVTSTTFNKKTYNFAGVNPVATVSIGAVGKERQLTNLASGRISESSTDAINGSQLFATNQAVNSLFDNDKLNVKYSSEQKDQIVLAGENGTTISNLKDGSLEENSKEAVTGGQVHSLTTKLTDFIKAVTDRFSDNEQKITALESVKPTTTVVNSDAPLNVKYTSEQKDQIVLAGENGTTISNLKDGSLEENSKEAVTGRQIYTVKNELNNSLNKLDTKVAENTKNISSIQGKADEAKATADNAHTRINDLDTKTVQYNTDGDLVTLHSNNGKGTKIANVKNGNVSANSLDAVNGSQLHTVKTIADTTVAKADANTKSINTNRTRIEQLEQSGIATNQRVDRLDRKIHENRKRSDAGIAAASAIAIIPQVTNPSETGVGVGTTTKNGQSAIAIGASKSSDNGKHIIKLATSYDSQHNFIGAAGYMYKW